MRYIDSYRFAFQSDNWQKNLLFASVCVLIPYVGMIVLWGYLFEITEFKHRHGDEEPHPDFDFNRFADYLKRGVWPFLVRLVLGLVTVPLVLVLYVGIFLVAIAEPPTSIVVMLAMATVVGLGLLTIALTVVTIPIYFRAGFQQDFAAAFSLDYVKQFVRLTWRETILSSLFLAGSSFVLAVVGLLFCYVGVFPAMALIMFAQAHIEYQLYELYLRRGGSEIPLKTPAPPVVSGGPSAYLP